MEATETNIPDSVSRHFAECELDDPKPFASWEPSPRQIEEWAAIIRDEREALKLEDIE
jgi:hypothetical protein